LLLHLLLLYLMNLWLLSGCVLLGVLLLDTRALPSSVFSLTRVCVYTLRSLIGFVVCSIVDLLIKS
jgi:hypothetical protein